MSGLQRAETSGDMDNRERESQLSSMRSSRFASRELGNNTIFARVAYNQWFQNITMVVIVVNALWIGADTQFNHKNIIEGKGDDAELPLYPASFVIETIFCTYFSLEVAIRFLAFRNCCDCLRDAWFVFDFILVLFMVIETWILKIIEVAVGGGGGLSFLSNFSALRLLRLLRLTRMARLMRFVPELMTIVKGMLSALKSVGFIILFLMCVTYVFAICFTSMFGAPDTPPWHEDEFGSDPTAEQMFATIGDSMMTLITIGILGDNLAPVTDSILVAGTFYFWLFMIFFAISCLTLLNMMIAVLCEVISSTAKDEEDTRQISLLKMCISDAFDSIDKNGDGMVSEAEWAYIKENKSVRATLQSFGIDEGNVDNCLTQMQASLFQSKPKAIDRVVPLNRATEKTDSEGETGLGLEELLEKVSELRPDVPASCLELSLLQSKLNAEKSQISKRLGRAELMLTKMIHRLGQIPRPPGGLRYLDPSGIDSALLPLKVPPMPPGPEGALAETEVTVQAAPDACLREVPTELLLHVLKMRSPTPTGSEREKTASMSPGHATYTCLQRISTDVKAARAG
mmetsp:Transcript_92017/g.173421  ORF Transcript_92017/g.173421 Transcript_92017/m.173421 type:complete len:571 (-) Transcript_92017:125-1837(-)